MTTEAKGWNPRYVQFARVHGRSADEQLARDRAKIAPMLAFILWNGARIREFLALHSEHALEDTLCGDRAHAAYDAWLASLPVGRGVEP